MKLKIPSAKSILLMILLVVAVAAQFIPAGQYDKVTYNQESNTFLLQSQNGDHTLAATQKTLDSLQVLIPIEKFASGDIFKPVAVPNTYHGVAANRPGVGEVLTAPVKGMANAVDVILFILIIGGFIGVVNYTGAIDDGLLLLTQKLKGQEFWLIVLITALTTAGGTTFGMAEELIAFVPVLIPIFVAAGYDAMLAMACLFLGSCLGTTVAITNPFSTIIASDAAGISWTADTPLRLFTLCIGLVVTVVFLLRYGAFVKRQAAPVSATAVALETAENLSVDEATKRWSWRTGIILVLFALCFVVMIFGVAKLDWWFTEMTSIFLVGAIIIGLLAKLSEQKIIHSFIAGSGGMLGVALIVGIARGISVLMDESQISDTVLFYAGKQMEGISGNGFLIVMFFVFAMLAFFVPSTSGLAVLTMPIFAPMADGVGVEREKLVNAYMYGQGWFNYFNPTSLVLVYLAAGNLSLGKFMRMVWPLLLMLLGILLVMLLL